MGMMDSLRNARTHGAAGSVLPSFKQLPKTKMTAVLVIFY
jgi:hypothetical protein